MRKYLYWLGIFAFILSFWIASPYCYATDWDYVCSSSDNTKYYLDTSSVEKNDAYLRFWRKGVYLETKDGEKEFISYHEVHLANPLEVRMLHIISYDDSGNEARNYKRSGEWQNLRSGSIIYSIANAAMHYVN